MGTIRCFSLGPTINATASAIVPSLKRRSSLLEPQSDWNLATASFCETGRTNQHGPTKKMYIISNYILWGRTELDEAQTLGGIEDKPDCQAVAFGVVEGVDRR